MRLIDAEKLLNDYTIFGMTNISREDVRDELYDLIDNQPTAYDIDKVVEELNNKSYLVPPVNSNHYADTAIDLQDAIEIVKAGGKNE